MNFQVMVMETYYRKRHKNTNSSAVAAEKEAEQVSIAAAEPPSLGQLHHHVSPPPPSSDHCSTLLLKGNDGDKSQTGNHIEPGYLYEIDHKHLPPRTPAQLRSIRIAMVCEKTEMNVAVRFPSMASLKAFFNYSTRETHPALDEKFVMGIALAHKVLTKIVSPQIFSEQKVVETFWLIESSAAVCLREDNSNITVTHRKGGASFLSEALRGNGMVRWGVRRQVKYLGRHREIDGDDVNVQNSSSSFIDGVEGSHMGIYQGVCDDRESMEEEKNVDDGDGEEKNEGEDEEEEINGDDNENEDEEEEDDDDDEEEEEEKIKKSSNYKNLKRKRYSFRNIGAKKTKNENLDQMRKRKPKKSQNKKNKGRIRFKEALVLRDPKDRWSTERYKLAEQNLLNVMKSKGATSEKPILRPQLRAEARKKIGDTGLLDHLLKHMAGKLAPGGEERFRRRHNPDGAMEYWLESADLVNIRKDAGVTDPYWVPPPGWKPGDSPTQDPICARELKLLKDDITNMKRDFKETKKQLEDEVGRLKRELNEITATKRRQQEEESQAITIASSRSDISQKLDQLATSLDSSKYCDFGSDYVPVEKYKEQLMAISDFVKEIEEKLGESKPKSAKERPRNEPSLMAPATVTDTHTKEKHSRQQQQQVQEALIATGKKTSPETTGTSLSNQNNNNNNVFAEKEKITYSPEEKAAKIQRMKSGFRICKPQGTFLWPNMVKGNYDNINCSSSQVMVQVEVPTPPSVNSSANLNQLLVKPMAEKRAVNVTVSTVYKPPSYHHDQDGGSSYNSNSAAAFINLNDVPPKRSDVPPMQVSPNASTTPLESGAYTCGLRNAMGMGYDQNENNNNNNNSTCCCSSATSMPGQVDYNWLALSTLKSASDDSTHG